MNSFQEIANFVWSIADEVLRDDIKRGKYPDVIERKERLIALLEEKRAALINRAVTKGLDTSAPTKDSGVPWLGSVPAHWRERKLGYLVRMVSGSTPDKGNSAYWQGGTPWVSAKDMKTSAISDSEDHISDVAVRQCGMRVLPAGTVLTVVRGMILAHTFPIALTTGPVTINQDMKALLPNPDCAPEFLAELLRGTSRMALALVEDSAHGTKCLRTDLWKGFRLFLPPLPEQHEICAWVGATARRFDAIISKTRAQISKFHEYRTALISAAVTGMIDVRDHAAESAGEVSRIPA
jgi:type I restriction enzyme S subunit